MITLFSNLLHLRHISPPAFELTSLLDGTETGVERCGLSGHARALLYRLIAETGLRASEARSLKVSSLSLATSTPTVTVMAKASKRRRDDVQPIPEALAQRLRTYSGTMGKWDPLFPVPKSWRPAEMLR